MKMRSVFIPHPIEESDVVMKMRSIFITTSNKIEFIKSILYMKMTELINLLSNLNEEQMNKETLIMIHIKAESG